MARAKKLTAGSTTSVTTEAMEPVDLKFCVDAQYLPTVITLGFIPEATAYQDLDGKILRAYLDGEVKESKEIIIIDYLDDIVQKDI